MVEIIKLQAYCRLFIRKNNECQKMKEAVLSQYLHVTAVYETTQNHVFWNEIK